MYIVHVILNEPYTFNFTDKYSLKYMKSRSMKYNIAIMYTDELLILRDSRYNYLFKEINENDYHCLKCNKTDMIKEFNKNSNNFTFHSITNVYSLPVLPGYVYDPLLKIHKRFKDK
jgi:hypothetical protein